MKMTVRLTAAFCLMIYLCAAALGEAQWTDDTWRRITAALASDVDMPVPAAYRLRAEEMAAPEENGWMTVLLMSTDAGDMAQNFGRADVLLLCAVQMQTGAVRLLSLPEDALIPVQGLPEEVQLRYVNCFGGPGLTAGALRAALQLGVSRYCAVNMEAFVQIVDVLGGVALALTEGEAQALNKAPGTQTLTGEEALHFVRLRRPGDGSSRARALLEAILAQALRGMNTHEMFAMMDALLPLIDTNLTTGNLVDLMLAVAGGTQESTVSTQALSAAQLGPDAALRARTLLYEGE